MAIFQQPLVLPEILTPRRLELTIGEREIEFAQRGAEQKSTLFAREAGFEDGGPVVAVSGLVFPLHVVTDYAVERFVDLFRGCPGTKHSPDVIP